METKTKGASSYLPSKNSLNYSSPLFKGQFQLKSYLLYKLPKYYLQCKMAVPVVVSTEYS